MKAHQRYFALEGLDGVLRPNFITVANGEGASSGPMVLVLAITGGIVTTIFAAGSAVKTLALLVAQFLPMLLGVAIAKWAPALASRVRRPISAASLIMLVTVIVGFVFTQGPTVATQGVRGFVICALLVAASIAGGWVSLARWPNLKTPGAFASGIRNLSLALVLSPPELPEVSAGILAYGLAMYVVSIGTALGVRGSTSAVK